MSGTRRKPGELGRHVEGYREWLTARGYTPLTVRNMLKDLGQVGQWMSREALVTSQLDEGAMFSFLAARHKNGRLRELGPRAMMPLLTFLREVGVTPGGQPSRTPLAALLGEYRIWMLQERGLAPTTMLRYENTARRFLQQQTMTNAALEPAQLTGLDIKHVSAAGVRSGLRRFGEGSGRGAPLGLALPVFAGPHSASAGGGRASGGRVATGHAAAACDERR
jgi:site-specific recombinase XerC